MMTRIANGGWPMNPNSGGSDPVAEFEALAEQAYDEMYDAPNPTGRYSDLKDYFIAAIGAAERLGRTADAERLTKRLAHCKAVFRSQFS
jgi:hypothetical protein